MDIKGKLAPLALRARTHVVDTFATSESAILRLPRPLSNLSNKAVRRSLSQSVVRLVIAATSFGRGEAVLMFNVKNRQLTKYGRVTVIISLVAGSVIFVLNVHEAWARLREPKSSDDFESEYRDLLRVRGGFKKTAIKKNTGFAE